MSTPAQLAAYAEAHPKLPPGPGERVAGYGVMGLPFSSGHVLGLRRWTAASVGEGFTSVWHRDPAGRWTFHESLGSDRACTRYFGAGVDTAHVGPINLHWRDQYHLRVRTLEGDAIDWTIELASTPLTRAFSFAGSRLPERAWRSDPLLSALGHLAGKTLRVGRVKLVGATANQQRFQANPLHIWRVTTSRALVNGLDLGPTGPVSPQAHLADFYFPQRGLFVIGRVFFSPSQDVDVTAWIPEIERSKLQ